MKKLLAILLFSIHAFNLGGYQIIFSAIGYNASSKIVERLDGGDFTEDQLVEVKIPYPLPYAANHTSFERFDGEIEFNGVHYNYVKRKMVNDTLVILCIPNTIKTELNKAKSDLVAGFNNISTESPTDNKSPVASVIKLFKAESKPNNNEFNFSIISDSEKRNYFSFQSVVLTPVLQAQDRPPQL